MPFRVVTRSDGLRAVVEDAVRRLYWDRYQASLASFPDTLVAEFGRTGDVECAAGIRCCRDGFFSDCYLDSPADHLLGRRIGRPVERTRVVEVCNLAAMRARRSRPFIQSLIAFLDAAEAEWAIFTATRALRSLLERNGLNMIELARAERGRVANPSAWGTYYEHDPRVMATSYGMATARKRDRCERAVVGCIANA